MAERDPIKEAVIAGIITLGVVGAQYLMTSQSFQIEAKALYARVRQGVRAWFDGWQTGYDLGLEMTVANDGPRVVSEAEGFLMPGASIPVDAFEGPGHIYGNAVDYFGSDGDFDVEVPE